MAYPLEVYEPPADLRRRFARGQYIERSKRGEFACCLISQSPIKSDGNLTGTRSYVVGYLDVRSGLRMFAVHFFADSEGNIGASGRLDPKWLYEDGVIYTSNRRRVPSEAA